MGEITNPLLSEEFFQKSERMKRKEATQKAETEFFAKVVLAAAQSAAQEIAKLVNFKGLPFDNVVCNQARKHLESYLSENPEIRSAIFVANANRPEKAVQNLAVVVMDRYRKDPRSFLRPEFSVE